MNDLLGADTVFVRADGPDYLVEGASGVLATFDQRVSDEEPQLRHLFRTLVNRQATAHAEFSVLDAEGGHRLDVVCEAGDRTNAHLTISRPGGEVVGSVVAAGGMFTVFPVFVLRDPTGTALGRLTTKGAPCAYDAADREIARVTLGSTRPAFGKLVCEVAFLGHVPELSRVLVVAALIGWERSR